MKVAGVLGYTVDGGKVIKSFSFQEAIGTLVTIALGLL